jgi:hypothetical protein
MTSLAVVTPSAAPDYELCADLSRSIRDLASGTVDHHIVVPQRDLAQFGRLRGSQTHIHSLTDFLPSRYLPAPRNTWINLARPLSPIRTEVARQIVRLAVTVAIDADIVLLVDSDVRFIRPLSTDMFVHDGAVRLYRKIDEIADRRPRHLRWHAVSRRLLGLSPPPTPSAPDYVCWPAPWSPTVVRALLARVEEATSRVWVDAIAAQPAFSDETLYGVFVDELAGAPINSFVSDDMMCHTYSSTATLNDIEMFYFLSRVRPTDIAVMISARSNTPIGLRRTALDLLTSAAAAAH